MYADGGLRTVWEGPGWVRAGDLLDGAGFAVVGHPGPRFTLLRAVSVDVGGWAELGEIPAQSVTSALIMGPDEVWLLGADTLIRWKAGEFEAKSAPGRRDSTRDRLFRVGDQLVLGTPRACSCQDDGQRWGHRNVDNPTSAPWPSLPRRRSRRPRTSGAAGGRVRGVARRRHRPGRPALHGLDGPAFGRGDAARPGA
ncbi:MAG: hypothetical protein IPI35_17140 [Deltaproteobacteria bacterium]|nr:hypothetical protein [Deltaproteobacteria bacterium]